MREDAPHFSTVEQLRNLTCLHLQWSSLLVNEDYPISTNSFCLISQNDVDLNRIFWYLGSSRKWTVPTIKTGRIVNERNRTGPVAAERGWSKQFHTLSRDRSCNQKRPPKLKVSFGTAWIRRLFNFLLRVLPICELSTPALLWSGIGKSS